MNLALLHTTHYSNCFNHDGMESNIVTCKAKVYAINGDEIIRARKELEPEETGNQRDNK